MPNQFDSVVSRIGTNCIKYDFLEDYFGRSDLQPLWVADMDFQTPPFLTNALQQRISHPFYGYTKPNKNFYDSIVFWMKAQHNWQINSQDILHCTSVVASLSACVEALTKKGDEVIVQPPIYPPFFSVVTNNKRKLITNTLKFEDGMYQIDFKDLESKITKKTKLLLLCSPHNPTGRVWSKKELSKLAKICHKHNIAIVSDEIHADLCLHEKHIPIASLSKKIANQTITLNSPGKSFNLAGITDSYVICSNEIYKEKIKKVLQKRVLYETNIFVNTIYENAYTQEGILWLEELKHYLLQNQKIVFEHFESSMIKPLFAQSTYLMLLDFAQINLTHKQIKEKLINEAKVALNDGIAFGKSGHKLFRLNIALPKQELEIALKKISDTFGYNTKNK